MSWSFQELLWGPRCFNRSLLALIKASVSIAVKRHHGHSNAYKGKHFIGVGLQFQRFSHCRHGGTWRQTGRHGAGEAERLHQDPQATGSETVSTPSRV